MPKGQHADDYEEKATLAARRACLAVAIRLGGFLDDLVVVGGLVPSLLIQSDESTQPHVGTADLDIGISLGLLEDGHYAEIADRLRGGGFEPDVNERGNETTQRWRSGFGVTVDFLIPPTREVSDGGRLQHLHPDLSAIVTPGLPLAFQDRDQIVIEESLADGERATRTIGVCGPGAFIVLKSLAFADRGEPKDAYDLYYMLSSYGTGPPEVAERMRTLLPSANVDAAAQILSRDFAEPDCIGAAAVARFLRRELDANIQADAAGMVRELLRRLHA